MRSATHSDVSPSYINKEGLELVESTIECFLMAKSGTGQLLFDRFISQTSSSTKL
jgi:hypothetical protein